ncbi:hypothetical protein SCUCBS95973_002175 [Sporothrix curviconia]|uniref:Glucuronyl hydrolase n=1 Tax=Sporothrix curviconia TaxID=1260050 RepID=A0ABP0B5I2_9PEZI
MSSPSDSSSEGPGSEGPVPSDSTSVDGTSVDGKSATHEDNAPAADFGGSVNAIFAENAVAKITRTAVDALANNNPPTHYPEYVPQTGPRKGQYALRDADFWTCGFFPGSVYLVLERLIKFPHAVPSLPAASHDSIQTILESTAEAWDGPIRAMAGRTDTHDMAFIVMLSQRARYELYHDARAREAVVTAAYALHSRYNARVGAIRSWDKLDQNGVRIDSLDDDFLVIVDSMINLELLYYVAGLTGDAALATAATAHANTVMRSLFRNESADSSDKDKGGAMHMYSTFHVANFSPRTGALKETRTAQGYARDSTWARGQAWGILGFARTFARTRQPRFARAAAGLANYFLKRLDTAPACVEVAGCAGPRRGRYVPLWDFDAPVTEVDSGSGGEEANKNETENKCGPLRDSSAGIIAANGMLILSQALRGHGADAVLQKDLDADRYLQAAFAIVEDTLALSLARETAEFVPGSLTTEAAAGTTAETAAETTKTTVRDTHADRTFAAILKHATANANARDHDRYWNHGLVYADYYLLEFGNNLLRMGLV